MNNPINKILVFIDGTDQSITAAQYAIILAKLLNAQLSALFVVNTRALDDLLRARIFLKEEQVEYEHDLEADAQKYLNHVSKLAQQKEVVITTERRVGAVHQEIGRYVTENDIDLLVIGELSRVRSRKDEFYNETDRAMRFVSCSVLIVKDEDRVWDMFEKN